MSEPLFLTLFFPMFPFDPPEKGGQGGQKGTLGRKGLIKLQASTGETLAQIFSYEFCKDFKDINFTEQLRATASGLKPQ